MVESQIAPRQTVNSWSKVTSWARRQSQLLYEFNFGAFLIAFGSFWRILVILGSQLLYEFNFGAFLVAFGSFWRILVILGSFWHHLGAILDRFWAIFGRILADSPWNPNFDPNCAPPPGPPTHHTPTTPRPACACAPPLRAAFSGD